MKNEIKNWKLFNKNNIKLTRVSKIILLTKYFSLKKREVNYILGEKYQSSQKAHGTTLFSKYTSVNGFLKRENNKFLLNEKGEEGFELLKEAFENNEDKLIEIYKDFFKNITEPFIPKKLTLNKHISLSTLKEKIIENFSPIYISNDNEKELSKILNRGVGKLELPENKLGSTPVINLDIEVSNINVIIKGDKPLIRKADKEFVYLQKELSNKLKYIIENGLNDYSNSKKFINLKEDISTYKKIIEIIGIKEEIEEKERIRLEKAMTKEQKNLLKIKRLQEKREKNIQKVKKELKNNELESFEEQITFF